MWVFMVNCPHCKPLGVIFPSLPHRINECNAKKISALLQRKKMDEKPFCVLTTVKINLPEKFYCFVLFFDTFPLQGSYKCCQGI